MKIWFNDGLTGSEIVGIDGDGWPEGDGIFETIRTENGGVFELPRHMRRAGSAAKYFGFKMPAEELVRGAISQLLKEEPFELGRLRLLFSAQRFVAVHQKYQEITLPARLLLLDQESEIESIAYKTFPYTHRLELLEKAKSQGCDEVICINEYGEISEGAVSNFVFQINGQWVTTPLTAGILPGVQRAIVIERCGVIVKSLTKSDLDRADRALVISSLKIALSVTSIGAQKLLVDEECSAFAQKIRSHTQKHSVG